MGVAPKIGRLGIYWGELTGMPAVENEFHFIMKCKTYDHLRNKICNGLNTFIAPFRDSTDTEKFQFLTGIHDTEVLEMFVKFVDKIAFISTTLPGKKALDCSREKIDTFLCCMIYTLVFMCIVSLCTASPSPMLRIQTE